MYSLQSLEQLIFKTLFYKNLFVKVWHIFMPCLNLDSLPSVVVVVVVGAAGNCHVCVLRRCAGERYVQGVGQVTGQDKVKREVVHQLCIQPMAHSELVKALPEDVRKFYFCHFFCHIVVKS